MISRTLGILANHTRVAAVASPLLLVALIGSAAQAVNSYTASFSEKELKLSHPDDTAWDKWFESDIGYQRMVERNSPFIELVNNAASTSPVTEFHLTIGDNRFNFAPVVGTDLVQLGRTTPGFTLTSSTTTGGDDLVVNIGGGGLLPGQSLKFKIKLGIDPSFAAAYKSAFGSSVPDYRTVLFDMNGVNVYDGTTETSTTDNAQMYAIFSPGGKSGVTVLPDEKVAVSQFFNDNLRGGCCCVGDPVEIFKPIPEPGSLALAMLGIAGFSLGSRSRSRRLAA
jgi:hypothetical protein